MNDAVDYIFVATFFILRGFFVPLLWVRFMLLGVNTPVSEWGPCLDVTAFVAAGIGGVVFHSLNASWGAQICGKLWLRIYKS